MTNPTQHHQHRNYLSSNQATINDLNHSARPRAERLSELAEILALGLIRMKSRQSSKLSAAGGESSVDCAGDQSVHAGVATRMENPDEIPA
jgi:hypothetical protein